MYSEQTTKLVKQNLLEDLARWTGVDTSEFDIDFTEALGEGSAVHYNGEFVEGCSGIGILDKDGNQVGSGWIDHLLDQHNKLYSYWAYFDFKYGKVLTSSNEHFIPNHLWNNFDEETKNYLAKTHQGWHGDKKLNYYRIKYYPQEILDIYSQVKKVLPEINNFGLTKEADKALNSLLDRTERYLSGKELEYKNNRDVYVIENDMRFRLFEQQKFTDTILLLDKLENLINFGRIVFPKLDKNYLEIQ